MKVDLDREEIIFLQEAINYAEIHFNESISKYPLKILDDYNKNRLPDKKKMFEAVKLKLQNALH
jgi:bifunctional ADP-heptose synthase (sugar kinase/adenylyltransferase)